MEGAEPLLWYLYCVLFLRDAFIIQRLCPVGAWLMSHQSCGTLPVSITVAQLCVVRGFTSDVFSHLGKRFQLCETLLLSEEVKWAYSQTPAVLGGGRRCYREGRILPTLFRGSGPGARVPARFCSDGPCCSSRSRRQGMRVSAVMVATAGRLCAAASWGSGLHLGGLVERRLSGSVGSWAGPGWVADTAQ